MIATTAHRVADQTDPAVNEKIRRRIEKNLGYYQNHLEKIDHRLKQLDEEWDVERMLETGSSAVTLAGLVLGIGRNRRWLLLSLAVQGFFLQHALQGWCPPLPVLRRLGFRTPNEIEQERYGLKVLRGDFGSVGDPTHGGVDRLRSRGADQVLRAVEQ